MNMSNAYGKWVRENLPGVPVIYDHFHVIKAIKKAYGYRDFKYFRLKVFDLPNLKPPRPHAARGRATFPRTTGFCARERRRSVPNPTTFLGVPNTLSSMYYRSVQSRLGIPCCDSPDTIQFFKRLEPFINCQRQAKRLVLLF